MKFAVLICSVLLIAGAQAHPTNEEHNEHHHHSSWTERIERIEVKIQNEIQEGLSEIITITEAAVQSGGRTENNLKHIVGEYESNIAKQTNALLQETKERIQKSVENAGKIDVQECVELSSGLDALAEKAIKSMTSCANKKLEKGERYLKTLIDDSGKLISNLTSLQQEAKSCNEESEDMKADDDMKSTGNSIVCADIVGAKALFAIAQEVPSVSADIAKFMHFMRTLPLSLEQCSNNHGYIQFEQESIQCLNRVRKCIHMAIEMSERELLHEYIHHGDGHLKKSHSGNMKQQPHPAEAQSPSGEGKNAAKAQ